MAPWPTTSSPHDPRTTSPSGSGRSATGAAIRSATRPGRRSIRSRRCTGSADLGAYGVNFHDDDLVPPGSTRRRARGDPQAVPAGPGRDRHAGADGDDEPLLAPGVQGRRLHRERSRRAPATRCARRSTPSISGPSSAPTVFVMWGGREGCEADAAKDVPAALDCYAEARQHLLRVHPRPRLRHASSRSSRSRTSRGATCCCRRSVTRSRSSTSSSTPRWSGSTPSSRTRRCRACRSTTRSRRCCGPTSSSTSTSTARSRASTTRTSASGPRACATRSTS